MDYKAILVKHGYVNQFKDVGLCNLMLVNDKGDVLAFACDGEEKVAWRALYSEHFANLYYKCLEISDMK